MGKGTRQRGHKTSSLRAAHSLRHEWLSPVLVFALALLIRLIVVSQIRDLPIVTSPALDSAEYLNWAHRLAAGDFAWPTVSQHAPGYPLFLAFFLAIGLTVHSLLSIQAVLGALTAVMLFTIGDRLFGLRVGVIAGMIYVVYAPAVFIESSILAEGLLLLLLTCSLAFLSREWLAFTDTFIGGLMFGAAIVVRPTALFMAIPCGLWLIRSEERLRRISLLSSFAVAVLLVSGPFVIKSWLTSRQFTLQGYGGLNLYIGDSPTHSGRPTFRPGGKWEELNSEPLRAGVLDPVKQDRYFVKKALVEIGEHPSAFVVLLGRKVMWLVQAEEVRDSHSIYFVAEHSLLLKTLPGWGTLFPLGCLGIWCWTSVQPRSARRCLIGYYAVGAIISSVLLVIGTRYRMPIVPALVIAAAVGGDRLASIVASRQRPELISAAVIMALGALASRTLHDPRNRNLAEEWAFTGEALISERRLQDAEYSFNRALALDPTSGLAWDGLGLVMYDAGRLAAATDAFSRAIALEPMNAQALDHLGLVAQQSGELSRAVKYFKQANQLAQYDLEITRDLGNALLADNRPADAIPYLRMVAAQDRNNAEAHRALAIALGLLRQVSEAHNEMRFAVDLDPANGDAWVDLCLLALDAGNVSEARTALDEARAHGASQLRVDFASAALNQR